jgi:hypothetical protein
LDWVPVVVRAPCMPVNGHLFSLLMDCSPINTVNRTVTIESLVAGHDCFY